MPSDDVFAVQDEIQSLGSSMPQPGQVFVAMSDSGQTAMRDITSKQHLILTKLAINTDYAQSPDVQEVLVGNSRNQFDTKARAFLGGRVKAVVRLIKPPRRQLTQTCSLEVSAYERNLRSPCRAIIKYARNLVQVCRFSIKYPTHEASIASHTEVALKTQVATYADMVVGVINYNLAQPGDVYVSEQIEALALADTEVILAQFQNGDMVVIVVDSDIDQYGSMRVISESGGLSNALADLFIEVANKQLTQDADCVVAYFWEE